MAEPQRNLEIIGFCDIEDKPHGMDWIVLFAAQDRFATGAMPSPAALRQYAIESGYYPSGKRGAVDGKCDPVYRYLPSDAR